MAKKLKLSNLEFRFDEDLLEIDVPDLNFNVMLKTNKPKHDKINIQKKKKNVRDTSTNSKLF